MAVQIVMDETGDTRHEFDPMDAPSVAAARARFGLLKSAGYTAAARKGAGVSELIRDFDPAVEQTIFIPRLRGG